MPSTQVSFLPPSETSLIRARAEAILWVKSAIAHHGITLQQLEQADCFKLAKADITTDKHAKYMDAAGHAWDGAGCTPEWLQRAINAGQTIEHFRVS